MQRRQVYLSGGKAEQPEQECGAVEGVAPLHDIMEDHGILWRGARLLCGPAQHQQFYICHVAKYEQVSFRYQCSACQMLFSQAARLQFLGIFSKQTAYCL